MSATTTRFRPPRRPLPAAIPATAVSAFGLAVTLLTGAAALAPSAAGAQIPQLGVPPVRFHGEISSIGELYSIDGRERRRPSSLGRLYIRSTLDLFGAVDVGFDLLFTTESGSDLGLSGSSARQRLNQIGIRPEWSWGRGYIGSFADSYSPLTWNGVRVQGIGAAVNPGWLRLGAFGGRSQGAVAGGVLDGAYRRTMWGGRVGVGRSSRAGEGGYLDVVFLRTADDPGSLDGAETGFEPGSGAAVATNPHAVTPQENVVLSAVNQIPALDGKIVWRGEVAVSVHSRDRRAPELSDDALDEYSSLLRSLVTPRASTYGDVAYTGQLDLRQVRLPGATPQSPRTLSASLGYRYIGAGYVSLGLASLPADQSAVHASVSVRYRTWSASLKGLRQQDNLLGQKLATTVRDRLAGTLSVRLTPRLLTSVRASIGAVGNDAAEATDRMDFSSLTLATSQTLTLGRESAWRAVSWSHTYQQTGDDNPARAASALRAHDTDLRITLGPSRNLTLTPSVGLAFSRLGEGDWDLRHTYALASHVRGDGGRWSATAALSSSRLHAGGSIRASLGGRYRITEGDRIDVTVRSNHVTGLDTPAGGFEEYVATIGWSRSIR